MVAKKKVVFTAAPEQLAQCFTADSKSVLFTSPRNVYTARYTQLFTVPVDGGAEELLPIPHSDRAVFLPDGNRIAYNGSCRLPHRTDGTTR
jgi:hypothetical protein